MTAALLLAAGLIWFPSVCPSGAVEVGLIVGRNPLIVQTAAPRQIIPEGHCWAIDEFINEYFKRGDFAGRCVYADGQPYGDWQVLPVPETILGQRERCENL
jgi:hypothetical protein